MAGVNPQKKSSNYKVLIQIGMKLHNPQVIQAYREYLDGEEQTIEPIYSKYLRLYPEDSVWEILIKFCLFYLVDGRLWVQSSTPMWWAQKSESFKPQLVIQYRPVGNRKKFSYGVYAGNPELHIPHYNGDGSPTLPAYTIGKYSAKYTLIDQTYLMINAHSQEEAIEVLVKMAAYTIGKYSAKYTLIDQTYLMINAASQDEAIEVLVKMAAYTKLDKRPQGEIRDNISTNTRKKNPRMDGIKIEPFKAEYFTGGKYGIKGLVQIQL